MKAYPVFDGTQACANMDTNLFYYEENAGPRTSETAARNRFLLGVCNACPFKQPCFEYAIYNERYGFWGGTTQEQREKIRKVMGIKVVNPSSML